MTLARVKGLERGQGFPLVDWNERGFELSWMKLGIVIDWNPSNESLFGKINLYMFSFALGNWWRRFEHKVTSYLCVCVTHYEKLQSLQGRGPFAMIYLSGTI